MIAQVHGYCLAGGSELATGCDLVYVAEDAKIGYPAVRFGTPDMHFHAWFMGMRVAMEMMVTGDSISGAEAAELGWANRAFPDRRARGGRARRGRARHAHRARSRADQQAPRAPPDGDDGPAGGHSCRHRAVRARHAHQGDAATSSAPCRRRASPVRCRSATRRSATTAPSRRTRAETLPTTGTRAAPAADRIRVKGRVAILAVAVVLLVSSCSGGSSATAHHGAPAEHGSSTPTSTAVHTRTVTVRPIVLTPGSGVAAVARVDVTMGPSVPSQPAVLVTGASTSTREWTAAAWDAVMAATLRLGTACDGHRFTFRVAGPLDGTSASALLTIAVLALLRGDVLRTKASIAGTVDPDGSIGPVDGLRARANAAEHAGMEFLASEPVSATAAHGRHYVTLALADIDHAYAEITDRTLPALGAAPPSAPTTPASSALIATTRENAAAVQTDVRTIAALPAAVRDGLASIMDGASADIDRATALTRAGSPAGAFQLTREASTTAGAAAAAGTLVAGKLPGGVNPFSAQVQADLAAGQTARNAQLAALDRIQPRTLADVSALLAAYGAATDSAELAGYATALQAQFAGLPATTSRAQLVQLALGTAFFTALARG